MAKKTTRTKKVVDKGMDLFVGTVTLPLKVFGAIGSTARRLIEK